MTEARARRRRPFLRARAAAALALLVGVLSAGFVAWAYQRFIAYTPRAQLYVPTDADWSLHIDVERAQAFEPVRAHGLPFLNHRLRATAGRQEAAASRGSENAPLSALKAGARFDLALGLREIVVTGDASAGLTLALGGKFPERFTPSRLNEILFSGRLPRRAVVPSGTALGIWGGLLARPEPGIWLWATDPDALTATAARARVAQDPEPVVGARSNDRSALLLEARRGAAQSLGAALGIDSLASLRAQLWVTREARVEAELKLASPAASRHWVSRWARSGWPGAVPPLSQSIWAPLRPLLARATVQSTEGAVVRLNSRLTRAELDALAEAAAVVGARQRPPGSAVGVR